ncbi:MAG: MCE family protein [Chitinophagaceae bacterium]|nr:MCE family protein [Chitinophagaceae bacterium]
MAKRLINNVKLGVFVIAGLLLLILALYMIGRDSNLFGKNFELKVRFENVQGLTSGNNIRYAGIQVGTVRKVKILNDTLIEVTMLIDEKMKAFIHKTDLVSISTDGLMGNKLLNITPGKDGSPLVKEGDILLVKRVASTEEMMETLNRTNNNIAVISDDIKRTVQRINNSEALWKILEEPTLSAYLKESMANIRNAADKAADMAADLSAIVNDVKNGKGSLGAILTDTSIAKNLGEAVVKIRSVGDHANQLAEELSAMTQSVKNDINNGKGTVNALLKDSSLVIKLSNSLSNIEQGTAGFNANMQALKHNFLLRGYFRKLEKQKKREEAEASAKK